MNTKVGFNLIMLFIFGFISGSDIDKSSRVEPTELVPVGAFYLVKDIVPGAASSNPQIVATLDHGVSLLFSRPSYNSTLLYRSDGSSISTELVKDYGESSHISISSGETALFDNLLYFVVNGSYGSLCTVAGLWKSDGTEAGTERVKCFYPEVESPYLLFPVGGKLFFLVSGKYYGSALWVSDGSREGTNYLSSYGHMLNRPIIFMTEMNGELYLIAKTVDECYWELWTSDGTSLGTKELITVSSNVCARWLPDQLISLDSILYFSASDNDHGDELWRSDGTAAGTWLLVDLNPGISSSYPHRLTVLDSNIYFVATGEDGQPGLWRSDGSLEGTYQIKSFKALSQLMPFQGEKSWLYFIGDDGEHGTELWKSDGTFAGTGMVKDIALGKVSSSPSDLLRVNDLLFFTANSETHGRELWVSDGTEAGTQLVYDLIPGPGSSSPKYLNLAGDKVFFSAEDNIHGRELWAFFINPKILYLPQINRQ
jgi:ELWxxDGT repeat protein